LSALLGATPQTEIDRDHLRELDIDRILPNANQPRKSFDDHKLSELADSIRTHGVVQPVIVHPLADGLFQLIAGERRWRAAQIAGLTRIPAVVREGGNDDEVFEIALIENLQREDLNPIEEALAYEQLMSFGHTQDEVARRVGKSRATIANMLRLLRLPDQVREWLTENKLSTGHAKALLSLSDLATIVDSARKVIAGDLSVRQTEALVAKAAKPGPDPAAASEIPDAIDPNVQSAIHQLELALGTKVSLTEHAGKGRFEIHFFSAEEMNRLYDGLLHAKF
jgi:ParB family chromosome partitioning protein